METLWKEVHFALRSLTRRPAFVGVAVLTLGLGICFVTTIFSFLNTLVLRPFPYEDPDRIVRFSASNPEQGWPDASVCPRDMLDLREQGRSFAGVSVAATRSMTVMGREEPFRVRVSSTFANFFDLLGVKAALGRTFLPEEEQTGKHRVAVLSHGLWQRRFGSDAQVIGRPVVIEGESYSVIGVAPAGFEHPIRSLNGDPDIWIPLEIDLAEMPRGNHWAQAVGRLMPGVSLAAARAELDNLSRRLAQEFPESNAGWRLHAAPLAESESREVRPALLILLVAAALVLLIVCFNLANLLLASALTRQKEIAIRAAVGALRSQLVRQLLLESLLVSFLGGALGLALTPAAIKLLVGFGPEKFPRMDQIAVDSGVLGFSVLVTILTALLFGLLPALRTSRVNLQSLLKEGGGREASGGAKQQRLRDTLVVAQLAFSVILLVAGGLLARSLARLTTVDPGITDPANVVSMEISVPEQVYPEEHQVADTFREVLERLGNTPGVQSAGAVNALPFTTRFSCVSFQPEDRPPAREGEEPCAHYGSTAGDYFRTMGIRLLRGRLFTPQDDGGDQQVVVINQAMAQRFWPNGDAIGKRLRWIPVANDPWKTVVGVVSDVKHRGLASESMPEVYVPHPHDKILEGPRRTMVVVVRSTSPQSVIPTLRSAVWSVDKNLPVDDVKLMKDRIADSLSVQRLGTGASAAFSAVALLLAALGLTGIVSYMVNQRVHEFGVRLAIGAQPRDVLRLVVGQGGRLALIGLVLGLAGGFAVSKVLQGLLFGVRSGDPAVFASVAIVVASIALLASYLPARRASRVDPVIALRVE